MNKTRKVILDTVGRLGVIDTGNFTQRHFDELEKMEEDGLVRCVFINSTKSNRTWFINEVKVN
jgi:hypothetical protein